MKILFVCKGNVGRSQMAEALFKKYSKHTTISAGTQVNKKEGEKLENRPSAKKIIDSMKEEGFDFSKNQRKQITTKMVNEADKIILMIASETVPDFLKNNSKVIYWNVEDLEGKSLEEHRKWIKQMKELIKKLIERYNL